MSAEQNIALVQRLHQEAWKGNIAVIDELVAPDILIGGLPPKQWKEHVKALRARWPDLTFTIDNITTKGNAVIFAWTIKSTKAGGNGQTITGVSINRVDGGKVVEDHFVTSMTAEGIAAIINASLVSLTAKLLPE